MKRLPSLITLFFLLLITQLPLAAATAELPKYGFQIDPLNTAPQGESTTALMTFLPVTEGFAPNINVIIQSFAGTIEEYNKITMDQFKSMNLKVISESNPSPKETVFEYAGKMNGQDLHFYARAISKGSKIYLVTATAKQTQWPSVGKTLRKHVDSFRTM